MKKGTFQCVPLDPRGPHGKVWLEHIDHIEEKDTGTTKPNYQVKTTLLNQMP